MTSIDPNCMLLAAHHYALQQSSHACDGPARKDGENDISNATSNSFTINCLHLLQNYHKVGKRPVNIEEQITKCIRDGQAIDTRTKFYFLVSIYKDLQLEVDMKLQ